MSEGTIRHGILKLLEPLTKEIGKIGIPVDKRCMTLVDAAEIMGTAKPGDIMLSRKRLAASNLVIPGFWKHAVIVVDDKKVVEAVGSGVRLSDLGPWCLDHDYVMLLRPLFASDDQMSAAAALAKTLVGLPYDDYIEYNPDGRSPLKAYYCSEIIWWCYDQVFNLAGLPNPIVGKAVLGTETLEPEDFAKAKDQWQCSWVRDDNG